MPSSKKMARSNLDLMLLSVLAEEPLYGYLIQAKIREASGDMVQLPAGSLYPLLHQLEEAGLIQSTWDRSTGRGRKWYQLTAKGQKRLKTRAAQWQAHSHCIRKLLKPALQTLSDREGPDPLPA